MQSSWCGSVISLYRAYSRQIRRLPLLYLRQFFRIKASDDIRAILRCSNAGLRRGKLKRVSKDLREVEAANNGSTKAFTHVLDLAYGRKGKLRWEIMKPIFSDPNARVPPRIIPSVEKSRPPVYSPEMRALLLSSHSRKTKPLSSRALVDPPTLPARADPSSKDAKLLGPFSKRREVNIRWRYFTQEWKKIRPPLEVVVQDASLGGTYKGTSRHDLLRAGIRGMGMQGYGVFDDVETVAGPAIVSKPLTRKERVTTTTNLDARATSPTKLRHPSRWLRRRYQELLGRVPILTYSRYKDKDGRVSGRYCVTLSVNALAPSIRFGPSRSPEVNAVADQEWLRLADKNLGMKKTDKV
ncbi:hypothetical protein LshimejAT787_0302690 [Lyophyllum shimeji]|uniref:LYR motif-containing protein Cup1-like N-terminal domain-containing protein n=1 Tax=Lyophyllum shimeji TaxID=47721 RepID=A0A9P3UM48_LYOSH|nr:hypothetical protein LshimejAT787_0302690 [Lyophyllum shimeji]